MTRISPPAPSVPDALTKAVGKGARVKVLVEEAAEDLSSVNEALEGTASLSPSVAKAVDKNAEVEGKIQVPPAS